MRCVILGGGISGLSLAHALDRLGVEPIVLEASGRLGGTVRSERQDGWLCEHGPVALPGADPDTQALVSELALPTVPAAPAAKRKLILAGGKLVPVPGGPLELLSTPLLGAWGKLRIFGDLGIPRGSAGLGEDESVASFARRRFGKQVAERVFHPLTAGIYAGDPAAMSVLSAFPKLARLEQGSRSVIAGAAQGMRGVSAIPSAPAGGMEDLIHALAARLTGKVHLHSEARGIEYGGRRFRVAVSEGGRLGAIAADAVVSALPAYAAAPVLRGIAPRLADAASAVPYSPVTLVYLGWDCSSLPWPLDAFGFLTAAGERSNLLGAVYASAMFPDSAPNGGALVSARIGGALHRELADLPDEAASRLAAREVGTLVGAQRAPRFVKVVRHERALPQYVLGHRWRVAEADAAEREHPGLFITGNAWRGVGLGDCVREATLVAERVARYAGTRPTLVPLQRRHA